MFANGVETTYDYGVIPGRLTELRTGTPAGPATSIFASATTGSATRCGSRTSPPSPGHVRDNRRHDFDALYRLIGAEGRDAGGTYQHSYDYDELGNLLTRPESGGLALSYDGMRLTAASDGTGYEHDDLGNLTADDGGACYDDRGRLIESTAADGTRLETCATTPAPGSEPSDRPGGAYGGHARLRRCVRGRPGRDHRVVFFYNSIASPCAVAMAPAHAVDADALGNPAPTATWPPGRSAAADLDAYGGVAVSM